MSESKPHQYPDFGAERPPGDGMEALERQREGSSEGSADIEKPSSAPNQHSELAEAMERANDSWAGRPYPVGPGVSQEFARAVQDRTTLATEVRRLEEQLEAAQEALRKISQVDQELQAGCDSVASDWLAARNFAANTARAALGSNPASRQDA